MNTLTNTRRTLPSRRIGLLLVALTAALLVAFVLASMVTQKAAQAKEKFTRTVSSIQGLPGYQTGIFIHEGDRVRITASGTVDLNTNHPTLVTPDGIGNSSAGTNFVLSGAHTGALLGSIGAFSETNGGFVIGREKSISSAPESGELYLIVNDCLSCFGDNDGNFTAHIKVKPSHK
jgi:hypothetical protein